MRIHLSMYELEDSDDSTIKVDVSATAHPPDPDTGIMGAQIEDVRVVRSSDRHPIQVTPSEKKLIVEALFEELRAYEDDTPEYERDEDDYARGC